MNPEKIRKEIFKKKSGKHKGILCERKHQVEFLGRSRKKIQREIPEETPGGIPETSLKEPVKEYRKEFLEESLEEYLKGFHE